MALLTFDTQHKPRQATISMAAILILMLIFPFVASQFGNSWVRIIDIALLYIMLALGLNIVVGFAGLLDLGYIAFFAVGAYLVGLFSSPQFAALLESLIYYSPAIGEALVAFFGPEIAQDGIHLSLWAIVPLAALCAALCGALLGAPTLKLRGDEREDQHQDQHCRHADIGLARLVLGVEGQECHACLLLVMRGRPRARP